MKKKILFAIAVLLSFAAILSFSSCQKDEGTRSPFSLAGTWWTAKSYGGNTEMFINFTTDAAFSFYDIPVSNQYEPFYPSNGTMKEEQSGGIAFEFRTATIDLDGYWKDKDLSTCGWFTDLHFVSGAWFPSKPTSNDTMKGAMLKVKCVTNDYIWGKLSEALRQEYTAEFKPTTKEEYDKKFQEYLNRK